MNNPRPLWSDRGLAQAASWRQIPRPAGRLNEPQGDIEYLSPLKRTSETRPEGVIGVTRMIG